ncbi:hypothetical protein [Mesorhizobium erdmanii]|uniref:hypothetical protein n=1 Tax=Mesorhizobium erdmanii TaxID=1777866 RepID=UPI00047B782F|nr:hypothetical protein [Mesorhizobium erdmanii]
MSDSIITISAESVFQEGAAIELAEQELEARKLSYAKLLDYLRAIGKEQWIPAISTARLSTQGAGGKKGPSPADSGTWTSEVLKALVNYPDGATPGEVLEVLRQGQMGEKATNNPNGLYNATAKLAKAGEIKKHHGRLFLPHQYEAFIELVQTGVREDYHGSGEGTIADMLVRVIGESDGLEAGEIVKVMRERGLSAGSVHNNLSKVVMKGRVRREGKIYLPLKNEALPEQSESASQITDGEIEPSLPNMGSRDA